MVPLRCVALSVVVAVVWTGRPNMKKKQQQRKTLHVRKSCFCWISNQLPLLLLCRVEFTKKKLNADRERLLSQCSWFVVCLRRWPWPWPFIIFFCSLCFSFYLLHSLICLIREMFSHKTINEIGPQPTTSHRTRNKERKNIQKITGWSTAINEITQTWPTTTNYAMRWANAIEQEMG